MSIEEKAKLLIDTIGAVTVLISALMGAIGVLASTIASFLPSESYAAKVLTKYFADVRGVRKALPPEKTP
jgi:hypothetical protein